MKVLITGSTGTLGRNLLDDPRRQNYELVLPTRRDVDLLKPDACAAMYRDHKPDAVIHVAATVGGIQDNISHPVRFLAENILISTNVINEAYKAGVPRLINIASSCMYPRNISGTLSLPLILTAPLEPTNEGYAIAKIASLRLTEYIVREKPELQYKTLIPCNLYGPHDNFHPLYSHLLQSAIVKMVGAIERGEDEVEIWGNGKARREFMFHPDFADFIWTFLPRIDELPDAINVGVGQDQTVTEYYELVAAATGFKGTFRYDPSRPHGMERKLLDVQAQTALGWKPKTDWPTGIRKTIEFYKANRAPDPRRER
jgi:GDP-L-fucose synthase